MFLDKDGGVQSPCPPPRCVLLRQLTLHGTEEQIVGRSHPTFRRALDRLPWSRFHILILIGLGITWILDGIEVTIVGAIAPVLRDKETLGLSTAQIGNAASA